MYGIDTNVLIRFLTQDDPKQAKLADKFILDYSTKETPIFINSIVLCELVWVLESAYKYKRELIIIALEKILMTKQFKIESISAVQHALLEYKHKNSDFADALIAKVNEESGCAFTVSFDKKGIKDLLFRSIESLE